MPTIRLENTFNPNVSFTKIKGSHTLKFGTNIVRRQIIDFQLNQGDGLFSFSPTFTTDPNNTGRTGDSMASFLLGTSSGRQSGFSAGLAGNSHPGDRLVLSGRLEGELPPDAQPRAFVMNTRRRRSR